MTFCKGQTFGKRSGHTRHACASDGGEWDSKRGEIEVYNKKGKHQGARDPKTGKEREGSQEPDRRPTYNRFDSEEPDNPTIRTLTPAPKVAPSTKAVAGAGIIMTIITVMKYIEYVL